MVAFRHVGKKTSVDSDLSGDLINPGLMKVAPDNDGFRGKSPAIQIRLYADRSCHGERVGALHDTGRTYLFQNVKLENDVRDGQAAPGGSNGKGGNVREISN
jgi:hypothetical protein